jgi:cysteine desulfurase
LREVYLDNAATTRTHPDVAKKALFMMREEYGNPSSLHAKGLSASAALEEARGRLAEILGCEPREVYFTSGGTESNNLALTGAFEARRRKGSGIVTTAVEHSSVIEPLQFLEKEGARLSVAPPLPDGRFDKNAIAGAVNEDTVLLSCMLVNSETGAVAPLEEISAAARAKNERILIHCDAVQGFGRLNVSPKRLGADLMSVSGHKLHAPKGIGALYIKSGVRILPILKGGGQQVDRRHGVSIRPGTENVPLACAFAEAASIMHANRAGNLAHLRDLCEYFMKRAANTPGLCINSPGEMAPYICNVSAPGYLSGHLVSFLSERGVYVSGGSACSGGKDSRVLAAMGLAPERIKGAVRVSLCPDNTEEDLAAFFDALETATQTLRRTGAQG